MSVKYKLGSRPPFASGWRTTYHVSLGDALVSAWRKHNHEWSVDSITQDQSVIFSRDELLQAFSQIDGLMSELPKRTVPEIAEQIIREMKKESEG
jgi:hypothetical protein